MNNTNDLATASREISFVLGANLGYEYWNVILVYGQFSRKTYASGGHYAVFQKFDGLTAIIWHNKLVNFILNLELLKCFVKKYCSII